MSQDFEDALAAVAKPTTPEQASTAWAEVGLDGGELNTGPLEEPIADDWTPILRRFGLDPNVFMVVDDTVRMSTWQQSKRLENGDRDLIWLFSYRARFRRKAGNSLEPSEVENLRQQIHAWKPRKPAIQKATDQQPATFAVFWADWQLGKSAGGGVEATVQRVMDSITAVEQRVAELRRLGRNIEQIALVNMGDPVEGCDGNYASQLFTVQLTQREQLLLALDLWAKGVTQLAPLADKAKFIGTLSNHGEWTRRGGNKAVTSDSDSADGFLADALQRILDGREDTAHLEWHIPHDEMSMQVELSGIPVAVTHGHKVTGKEIEWLRGQSIRLLRDHGTEPKLWITAHMHHFRADDFGPWWRFQCPSLDGGSKWFADTSGKWSTPGTLTMLIGQHDPRGWSDAAVL